MREKVRIGAATVFLTIFAGLCALLIAGVVQAARSFLEMRQ